MDPDFENTPWPTVIAGLVGGLSALAVYAEGRPALCACICLITLAAMAVVRSDAKRNR